MSMQVTFDLLKAVFGLASICVTICGGVRVVGYIWAHPHRRRR